MSMFWTDKSTRWYKHAAEYTKYYQAIYDEISTYIYETDSVCDIGCGLGYLSAEIAKKASTVTATDFEERPLLDLAERVKQDSITNLEILQSDWAEISDEPQWDIVVSSFFKSNLADISKLLGFCRKRLILVVSNGSEDSFLPCGRSGHFRRKADYLKEGLVERNIPFLYRALSVQFGQPLFSREAIVEFIKHYLPDCEQKEIDAHIHAHVKKIQTDSFGNEYFLSNKKDIGIFIIEKKSLERQICRFDKK